MQQDAKPSGDFVARKPTQSSELAQVIADPDQKQRESAYSASLDYLYGRINYERLGHAPYTASHYRLDRMRWLLETLGNPQNRYPIVHVAGTKGKGTVAHLVAAGLQACGVRTGLYTSPHLQRLEERFQFSGQLVTASELVELTQRVRAAAEQVEAQGAGRATFFELTTAMGMLHFADQQADCVVLEVGLGGRLDSTNVCSPVVSVITSISLDHQKQLGNTIREIAAEKAGIIKPDTPVVCSSAEPDARQVVVDVAERQQAPLRLIDRDFAANWRCVDPSRQSGSGGTREGTADVDNESGRGRSQAVAQIEYQPSAALPSCLGKSTWPTRLLGRHQAGNVAAALATLDLLAESGWALCPDKLRSALAQASPPARMQVVSWEPLQIVDTAHNPASIQAGLEALGEHFPKRSIVAVFASSRDKDAAAMLQRLLPRCEHLIVTAYQNNPRALPSEPLAELARQAGRHVGNSCHVSMAATPEQAWQQACGELSEDQLLYATGSFFLAAELLDVIFE